MQRSNIAKQYIRTLLCDRLAQIDIQVKLAEYQTVNLTPSSKPRTIPRLFCEYVKRSTYLTKLGIIK